MPLEYSDDEHKHESGHVFNKTIHMRETSIYMQKLL